MVRILLLSQDYNNKTKVSFRRIGAIVKYCTERGDSVTVACLSSKSMKGMWGETVLCLGRSSQMRVGAGPTRKFAGWRQGMFDRSTLSWIRQVLRSRSLREAARRADVVVASYGPAGPSWAAYLLSVLSRRPLVLDFRDLPESRTGGNVASLWLTRILEQIVIRRASVVSTVGNVLAEHLRARHRNADPVVMYNGWTEEDQVGASCQRGPEDYLYYAGTIYDHRMAALQVVCKAVSRAPGVRLKVRLLGSNADAVRQVVQYCGVADRAEILEPASQETVRIEQSQARAVLVLEALSHSSLREAGTITGKLMGLIASRQPGIAVCSEVSELSLIASKFPWWTVVSDCDKLSLVLRSEPSGLESGPHDEILAAYNMKRQVMYFRERLQEALRMS